ncbi:AAA family ATPase [Methylomonas sp. AM2-LC]|uniref:AAA family ATPase n=1 Tax=Methylomonas sp. AM2-LC TaxID=3153301 RepID=UPI0032631B22
MSNLIPKKFPIGPTFGFTGVPLTVQVVGFEDNNHPLIPRKKEYRFRRESLRDVNAFLNNPLGDGLYLKGPTGSGKTSLISQVAARLNWPVHQVTCHGRMEINDLIGQFMLSNGSMQFMHGPLAQAVRDGHILVLNEIDLIDPSELSGLNDIIEGQPLVIPQNSGEVIMPHPFFRLVATGNSAGQGDQSGLYQGVLQQNIAFMDRFRLCEIEYPTVEEEEAIVKSYYASIGTVFDAPQKQITDKMIEVANNIRKQFSGNSDSTGTLSVTMSTRTLLRWISLMIAFKGGQNVIKYSFERTLSFRVDAGQRAAIEKIAKLVFGDDWEVKKP